MSHDDIFWSAPTDALKRGYVCDANAGEYICLVCGRRFEEGTIYPCCGALHTARKAVELHVCQVHGDMFEYFLQMNKEYTALTERQVQLMRMFYEGRSDREIVGLTSANSTSTVRNQRFSLREKHKQAKIIVAMMELLEEKMEQNKLTERAAPEESLAQFHKTASMIDERYAITESEKAEVLGRYFDAEGNLVIKTFPAREKRKIIILQYIAAQFQPNEQYTEKQVNAILSRYYDDIATTRRYLIEYGLMDRKTDGSAYWLKL